MAAVSPNSSTIEWAGENGWIPMTTEITHPNLIPTHWEAYKRGAAKAGRTPNRRDWRVAIDIHVAETTEEARNDVLNHGMAASFENYFLHLFRLGKILDLVKPDDSVPDEAIDSKWLLDNRWIVGDPDHCLKQIVDYYNFLGGFGTLLLLSQDWDPAGEGAQVPGAVLEAHRTDTEGDAARRRTLKRYRACQDVDKWAHTLWE